MMKSKHTNPAKNNNPSKAKINPSVNPMLTFSSWQASLSMHKLKFGYVNGVFGPKVLPQHVPRQLFEFNVVEVLIRQFPFKSEEVHWLKVQFLRVFYATHLSQHIVQFILYVCMQSSQLAPNLSSPETKPTSVKIKNGVSIVCFLQQAYNASLKIKKFLLLKTWPANLTSQSSISSDHIAYTFVAFVSLIDVKVNYA